MASIINATTTNGVAITPDNSGELRLQTNNGTTAVTIDTSQNVGVGTSTITSSAGWSPRLVLAGTDTALVVKGSSGQENSFGTSGGLYIDSLGHSTGTSNNIIFRNTSTNSSYSASERMRITSDGNVGIGTSSPTDTAGFSRALDLNGSAGAALYTRTNGSATSWTAFGNYGVDGYINNRGAGTLQFYNNNAERMRIHSNGYITMGTTNTNIDAGPGFKFIATTNAYVGMVVESSINSQTNYHLYSTGAGTYRFYVGAGGTIYATATTIVAISDVRLKENIQDIDVGLDAIMALKPRKFDWKEGKGKDKKGDRGWIAQEFEQVFPDMIENWKDPAPEGEEPYKAVSADLIPVLVKAIQELKAELDTVKAELNTLKNPPVEGTE